MNRSVPALLAITLAGVLAASGSGTSQAAYVPSTAPGTPDSRAGGALVTEHRYRILGKLRLAFFWAGRDNVGSARMTQRSDGTTSALAFLVGSNPRRAPHGLNQWSYVREEVGSDRAEVFALRSLGSEERAAEPREASAGSPLFGVSCASFREQDVHSAHTTVAAPGTTYWMFDRLLEQIASSPQWREQRIARPAGASAGFLTALQQLMRLGSADAGALESAPAAVYVYNNAIYDLTVRNSQVLGRTKVGARWFDRLIRIDFAIRNRTTAEISRFGVTYTPDRTGSSLPIQIFYQPSFWLRVELRLDEAVEVPADPAADGLVLARIRAICATAGR